jgi:hypothetical protein
MLLSRKKSLSHSKALAIADITRARDRQAAWSQEAKEEGEAALIRAATEQRQGYAFSAADSRMEAEACFYWAKKRALLAKKYQKALEKLLKS